MAKPLLRIQRYFCRKPVRFFSLILLYLTAGSLVFLHTGFVGDRSSSARGARVAVVASEAGSRASSSDTRGLGIMSRVFRETHRSGRKLGPRWMRKSGREGRGAEYSSNWNRALKGRNAKELEDGRGEINTDCILFYNLLKMFYLSNMKLLCKTANDRFIGAKTSSVGLFSVRTGECQQYSVIIQI